MNKLKIVLCTTLALLAFAGNSILCRLALGTGTIDAASFTTIRLLSGIVVLAAILQITKAGNEQISKGSWRASFMLFLYAATFSFAYISLDTGTGALILFGSVQITMILASLISGNKLHYSEWIGMLTAFCGFVYLIMPGLATPSLMGFILMTVAGIAWGIYTLAGRGSKNPLSDTAHNFLRTLPFVAILVAATFQYANLSREGILLAVLSGGIASGLGYAVWYIALGGLLVTQAAVVQLIVPVIAAVGGVLFANEVISLRLLLSSIMILGGILTVILGKHYFSQWTLNRT
ncbi:DMT family transporter [Exilibacterium tricleocarpae]|uniref:DMT family transporter n=1 Tax=Exilibacterium tricleocarpae TaxID=2591008 RepID=A0A545TZL8_9GAMM|nr:DMT family transporter [Exilibacterium tricleocarpae]TQV82661.1 DMT family transporter [Exilibacterium tricleocarpae]